MQQHVSSQEARVSQAAHLHQQKVINTSFNQRHSMDEKLQSHSPFEQDLSDQSCHANLLIHGVCHSLPPLCIFRSELHLQQLHCCSELQPCMALQDGRDQPENQND